MQCRLLQPWTSWQWRQNAYLIWTRSTAGRAAMTASTRTLFTQQHLSASDEHWSRVDSQVMCSNWRWCLKITKQHIWCLSQARIQWQGYDRKGIWHKNGGWGGGSLINPDEVAPIWVVSVSATVIFPCTIKSRRAHLGRSGKQAIKWLCVCACNVGL